MAERLSALMDGEWGSEDAGGKAWGKRDAARGGVLSSLSAEDKQNWSLYHLVGDALRSDELVASPVASHRSFMDQVAARLEAEPALVAPVLATRRQRGADAGRHVLRRRVVPSFAAAAAAVTIAWVMVPSMHAGRSGSLTQVASLSSGGAQYGNRDGWQRVNLGSDHALDPYLEAHQQFASDRAGFGYAAYAGVNSDRR